jgi:hypothetical protein
VSSHDQRSDLARQVVDRSGNQVDAPMTVPLTLAGLPATTRDGRVRAAISELFALADAAAAELA